MDISPDKHDRIKKQFPNIGNNYVFTSDPAGYNCVAFAADNTLQWWWPSLVDSGCYWPENVPRQEDLPSFIACFKSLNYVPCGLNECKEEGYEKVAIYVDENHIPLHVAKQFPADPDGYWRSKLRDWHDVMHTLGGLSGIFSGMSFANYGNVAIILKRPARIVLIS